MKRKLLVIALMLSATGFAQNFGINLTGAAGDPSAALDVDIANKGVLVPRIPLTATNVAAPVTAPATSLLVYNTATAGTFPTNVTPGYYYWDGAKWVRLLGGTANTYWIVGTSAATVNTPGATGSLGTSDNNHIDLVTNGIVRGRLSNLGEFFIGTTATALAGDLMNGVSNVTFPWAINGYSSQNGSGVYGMIQAGTTLFAGVQGEYYGTNAVGAGVRGLSGNTTAGTSFANVQSGVNGAGAISAATAGSYKFGVYGSGGQSIRSGGVMGYDFGFGVGSLGYFSSGGVDYSVYGFGVAFTTGAAGGKAAAGTKSSSSNLLSEVNTNIGLGIYGGMMGGWIRGMVYGTHVKGEVYSMYVDGKTYTNEPITQLVETTGDRQPVYASSGMKVEISDRGKNALSAGTKYIAFSEEFKKVVSANPDELTITVTPMGNSNGIYISSYDQNGFTVVENNNGNSNVQFTWIVIGTRKNYETMSHDAQVLANDFDQKMQGVMYNDNNTVDTPQTMYWDGSQMIFNQPVPDKTTIPGNVPTQSAARPKTQNVSTQAGTTGN